MLYFKSDKKSKFCGPWKDVDLRKGNYLFRMYFWFTTLKSFFWSGLRSPYSFIKKLFFLIYKMVIFTNC